MCSSFTLRPSKVFGTHFNINKSLNSFKKVKDFGNKKSKNTIKACRRIVQIKVR